MRKIILLFITFLCFQSSFSQNDIQKKIYDNEDVQVKAEFPNGEKKFNELVLENLKKTFNKDLKGEVLVTFIVGIDGNINSIEIIKDVENITEDEIKKILVISPKWSPAEQEGYHVIAKVKFRIIGNLSN